MGRAYLGEKGKGEEEGKGWPFPHFYKLTTACRELVPVMADLEHLDPGRPWKRCINGRCFEKGKTFET